MSLLTRDDWLELWPPSANIPKENNPNQMQIEFFWPLTEQIPLDLDYTPSITYDTQKSSKLTVASINGGTGQIFTTSPNNLTWTTTVKSDEMETKTLSIVLDKKPNVVVRWLYKLLNINWKI
jgi:hypothetical protein